MPIPEVDFDTYLAWLEFGIKAGWIAKPVCETHENVPLRDWEEAEIEEGADPCILVARVWMDGYEGLTLEDFR